MIKEIKNPYLTKNERFKEIGALIKQQNNKTKENLRLKIARTTMLRYDWYVIKRRHWYSSLSTSKSNKIGIIYPDRLFCFDNEFLPLCRQIAKILERTSKKITIMNGAEVE